MDMRPLGTGTRTVEAAGRSVSAPSSPERASPVRSPWVRVPCPRPAARLRLICLPFAGGGASRYREWPAYFPDDVEIVAIQLPGREDRFSEPLIDSVESLAGPLLEGLSGCLDRPFALFGHSMGALIASELTRRLGAKGLEPVHFFASGSRPPHLPNLSPDRHVLPDREFVTAIRDLNGVPSDLLDNADFLDLILPTLRSDFKLAETYLRHSPALPMRCPVSALGGARDDEVPLDYLQAWSRYTTGPFDVHVLPGDHFFVSSSRPSLLRLVVSKIAHPT